MYCCTSSVNLPRVKIHSVVTYVSWLLRANGNDTFCEKAVKYNCIWIIQITSCCVKPLESISPGFLKLKQLPNLFCSVLEPGADCPKAVPFMLLESHSSHLPSWGYCQSTACTIHLPASGAVGPSSGEGRYVWKPEGVSTWHITALRRQPKELRLF